MKKITKRIAFELTTRQYKTLQRLAIGTALTVEDTAKALLVGSIEAAMVLELAQTARTRSRVKSPRRKRG